MFNTIFVTTIVLLRPSSSQNRFPVGGTLALILFEFEAVVLQMPSDTLAVFTITAVIGQSRASRRGAAAAAGLLPFGQFRRLGLDLLEEFGIGFGERHDRFC